MQQEDFGVIQKVCSFKTSNFRPAPPCSSLFILHAGCLWIFLNEKLSSQKRVNNYFFCKLNIKDGNAFYIFDIYIYIFIYIYIYFYIYIYIYIYTHDNNNKNIYRFRYKKSLKKSLCCFSKTFSNYQATC